MKIVFVKRPQIEKPMSVGDALRLTAKNGKAIRLTSPPGGGWFPLLRRAGLEIHQARRGKFILAWCENGTRATKKGAR